MIHLDTSRILTESIVHITWFQNIPMMYFRSVSFFQAYNQVQLQTDRWLSLYGDCDRICNWFKNYSIDFNHVRIPFCRLPRNVGRKHWKYFRASICVANKSFRCSVTRKLFLDHSHKTFLRFWSVISSEKCAYCFFRTHCTVVTSLIINTRLEILPEWHTMSQLLILSAPEIYTF